MNRALASGVPAERPARLPPRLAELIRPELPSLAEEIVAEIRRAIPEYARPLDGPYGHVLRLGVERSLTAFTERIAAPAGAPADDDPAGTARMLGQYEAHEGRSMDSLQAAYRIGGQVAWRRVMKVAPRHDISSAVLSRLAEALLAYMDELAAQSLDGYLHAKARPIPALDERRRRLLRLLLAAPGPNGAEPAAATDLRDTAELVDATDLRDAADGAGWALPDQVTPVAVEPGAPCAWTALDEDVLAELECPEPHLLLPGPFTPERRAMLDEALPGRRIAVGVAMPVVQAADSLRWARRALGLALDGVLDGPVTLCEENLVALWLLSDPALVEQLTRRHLGILDGMPPGRQDRLTETLRTWLVTRGTAAEIAERLHIHPQTVRYRMRKIEQTLGDALADPEARFGIEIALRAAHLRSRRPAPATGAHRPAAGRGTPARPRGLRHLQ